MRVLASIPRFFVAAVALVSAVAFAASPAFSSDGAKSTTPNPYTRPNDSWISISGTVKDVRPNTFTLEFGKGDAITVEMDDRDRDADAYELMDGDKVTVYGKIDDDFFETTKIEASSVYVEKLGTYFWASAEDEEDMPFVVVTETPIVVSAAVVLGKVTAVDDAAKQFTIDIGTRKLTVETNDLGYDPLDDEGYQRIRVGDVVRVSGVIDYDLMKGRELMADSVVTLYHRS